MLRFNQYINKYFTLNKNLKPEFKKGFIVNGDILITNGYGLIVIPIDSVIKDRYKKIMELDLELLNYNDYKNYNKENLTSKEFNKLSDPEKKNYYYNELFNKLITFKQYFKDGQFCNIVNELPDLKDGNKYLKLSKDSSNNLSYDIKMINNLNNIINNNKEISMFTSKTINAINLTGRNGYCYLLPVATY